MYVFNMHTIIYQLSNDLTIFPRSKSKDIKKANYIIHETSPV